MKIIASCAAVDTGNCIVAQVSSNYNGKVSEWGQMYAVMIKALYGAANEMLEKLPHEESKIIFAQAMADSLKGMNATVFETLSKTTGSLKDMNVKEVIRRLQADVERESDAEDM